MLAIATMRSSTVETPPRARQRATRGAVFTPDSKVTLPTREARVILTKVHVIGDPDVDHLEVVLT